MEQRPDIIEESASANTMNALPGISETLRYKIATLMKFDRTAATLLETELVQALKPRARGRIEHRIDKAIHEHREATQTNPHSGWRIIA